MLNQEDIAEKFRRKSKDFDREYASGNFTAAVQIFDHAQVAADFLEINEQDISGLFGQNPNDRNKRLGMFDNNKVMTAKTRVVYARMNVPKEKA